MPNNQRTHYTVSDKFLHIHLKSKFVITFFTIFLVAIALVSYLGFSKISDTSYKLAISKDTNTLNDIAYDLEKFVVNTPKDLNFLASSYSFKKYLLWNNIGEKNLASLQKRSAIDTFLSFSQSKQSYFKIRFIDKEGNEQISIVRDFVSDKSVLNLDTKLQNKSDREYFRKAINLNKNVTIISDVDLNREFGHISEPYLPIVRFSMPVIDTEGIKHGVFVISIYARDLLKHITEMQQELAQEKREIYLIDRNGYYLFNKNKSKLWGKDLPHKSSLKLDNNDYFKKMQKDDEGFFEDNNYLYNFKRIYPSDIDKSNYWIIYTISDRKFVLEDFIDYRNLSFLIIIFILFLVFLFINLYINKLINPLAAISRNFEILALGKVPDKNINYQQKDEIGAMCIFRRIRSPIPVLFDHLNT